MNAMLRPRRAKPAPVPIDLRRRLEAAVDRLIATLDALDEPDMDREDGHDAEAEFDEPSLGATEALDQCAAWREGGSVIDGEATGTEDDLVILDTTEAWRADRQAVTEARDQLRAILHRRNGSNAHGRFAR